MNKKMIAAIAAMTLSAACCVTSYAAGGQVTYDADGAMYYVDQDGHRVTNAYVDGMWFGADGKRVERSLQDQEACEVAARIAKDTGVAVHTDRYTYGAEMRAILDDIFGEDMMKNALTAGNVTYVYGTIGDGTIIACINGAEDPRMPEYDENTLTITYAHGSGEAFDAAVRDTLIASLGTVNGQRAFDLTRTDIVMDMEGKTDTGNTFRLARGAGDAVVLTVSCAV